jgi:MFS family permease
MATGLTALVLGLNNLDTGNFVASLTSWSVGGALLVAAIVTPLFWRTERRAADPIIKPAFFASRQITLACVISAGVGALQSGGVFGPALIVSAAGVTESTAAWLLIPGVVVSMIASPIAGRLVNTIGSRRIILVSIGLVTSGLIIYGFSDLTITLYVIANLLSGLGMAGLLGAPLRFIVLRETGANDRASGQGLLSVATSIGRLLGAAIVGSIATSVGGGTPGYQAAFIAMAALAGTLSLAAWLLRAHQSQQDAQAEAATA